MSSEGGKRMSATEDAGGERCDCQTRLAQVVTHTRTSTHGYGPDYCAECSEAVSEWVKWPCTTPVPSEASEAGEGEFNAYRVALDPTTGHIATTGAHLPAEPDAGDVEALAEALTVEQANELVGDDIGYWLENPFMTPDLIAQKVCFWLAAVRREAGASALTEAADEMEAVIADGDCAEVAAPVQGEVGRSTVVDRRDALYEEPHTWLRARAARMGGDS